METIFPPNGLPPVVITAAPFDTPVIMALPHSGTYYPDALLRASRLSALSLRRSEDAHLDSVLGFAPALGISIIATPYARAYVDMNRDPAERDPLLIGAAVPPQGLSDRVAAGLGVVPRVVGTGLDIYAMPLDADAVQQRITAVHEPYHQALRALIARTKARHGFAVLFDCHSMPSGTWQGKPLANIVLGDRQGRSCAAVLTASVEQRFAAQHLRTARNAPYAGGYTTAHHGAPIHGVHVLQIEMDRGLYMDEAKITLHQGYPMLRQAMAQAMTGWMAALPGIMPQLYPYQALAAE
jgi:N-formylglutamate amidohydrolase